MSEQKVYYPVQCSCGHIYLEKYAFSEPTDDGAVGFCWCGFCRSKLMVYPVGKRPRREVGDVEEDPAMDVHEARLA